MFITASAAVHLPDSSMDFPPDSPTALFPPSPPHLPRHAVACPADRVLPPVEHTVVSPVSMAFLLCYDSYSLMCETYRFGYL